MYRLHETSNRNSLEAFGHGLAFGVHTLGAIWHLTGDRTKQSLAHAGLHSAVALYDLLSFLRHLDR